MSSDLPVHPVHDDISGQEFDVFIAGSGPIGATYARLLVDKGYNVCMVEIGDVHDGLHPAAHQKNEIRFQKDIDAFVRVIQGALSTVSIPTSSMVLPTLDPSAWRAPTGDEDSIVHGRNPHQELFNNLGAEAVTRCVGGMATHWTCATPEFLKGLERPVIFPNDEAKDDLEWKVLYQSARKLIGTSEKEFDHSIRHNTVLNALKKDPRFKDRGVKNLPLACHRINGGSYVRWHSAENIYGDNFFVTTPAPGRGFFRLLSNTRCTKIYEESGEMKFVEVRDLIKVMKGESVVDFAIKAKMFVIAAGAVATPQILANSGFGGLRSQQRDKAENVLIPYLAKRITEQPMAFCQIVLRQELVDAVDDKGHPAWWTKAVLAHRKKYPTDPIHIPVEDPEPQVTIPASAKFPWHTQIHRDAFSYGEAGPTIDPRLVVDLRFFGMQEGVEANKIIFEDRVVDSYEMPQATFEYMPTPKFAKQAADMMNDMTNAASVLGGYLPGSSPQFMTPGLALHLGGTIRLGHDKHKDFSVADYNSLVWDTNNLYVAGNGTIPTPFGANPTLTSMCLAIRSAYTIHKRLAERKVGLTQADFVAAKETCKAGTKLSIPQTVSGQRPAAPSVSRAAAVEPTPAEWVKWLTDESNPYFPHHEDLRKLENVILLK